jgi:hypothetical protein
VHDHSKLTILAGDCHAEPNAAFILERWSGVAQTCFLGLRLFRSYGNCRQTKGGGPKKQVRATTTWTAWRKSVGNGDEQQVKRQNAKVKRSCGFAICVLRFAF